ncbi:MAG: DUF1566 domain-containing protein [Deltaproteobacteria bacterium]|nr:DUF1566 domain-containing protein [Deltaproteobacteria bacterium]
MRRQKITTLFTLVVLLCCLPAIGESLTYPAPVPRTGQTTPYGTGDDGALRMGVAWPSPRFTDNGNGSVTDNLTGLIWLKNANCFPGESNEGLDWFKALAAANALASGSCGLTDGSHAGDWRLPNVNELQSLTDYNPFNPTLPTGHPFVGVQLEGYPYWSSTICVNYTGNAWDVSMSNGAVSPFGDINYGQPVWPVRGGQSGSLDTLASSVQGAAENGLGDSHSARAVATTYPAPIPKTGLTTSYIAGDDGALQKGVALPSPRFTDNGNGTVTDNLTGLIWLKNANCFDHQTWTQALADANGLVSGNCGLTDGSHAGDWRLPNVNELQSLIDYGHVYPTLPAGHPFSSVQYKSEMSYYWSSTSGAYGTDEGWYVYMALGYAGGHDKTLTNFHYVWPVRSGQSGSSNKTNFDFNADGKADVIWRNANTGQVWM